MDTKKIEKNGKIYMLAYDQGLEHGPVDFTEDLKNYDPARILEIAVKGNASCVTMQYGLAKQVYTKEFRAKMPLILKVNGKTKLNSTNYLPSLTASVEEAKKLGAVGIGFTINPGQTDEHIAFDQFCELRREAEKAKMITILWAYARGPEIKDQFSPEIVAYATRTAAELGADVAKVKYTGDPKTFEWAVKVAGKTKVVASGTDNFKGNYVKAVTKMMESGAYGVAVGRKVWQDKEPIKLSKELAKAIYK